MWRAPYPVYGAPSERAAVVRWLQGLWARVPVSHLPGRLTPCCARWVCPISPRPPSLFFGPSVPRPCPTDCLLLPPLWGGRGRCAPCRCAPCPAVPTGHPPPAPSEWPFGAVRPPGCPYGTSSSLPFGVAVYPSLPYGLRPPPSLRSGRLVPGVPPVPQVKVKHHGGSRHPWAEVRSGRGKRGHQDYGVTPS